MASVYKSCSDYTSVRYANALGVSIPVAVRAIAPTGSIGILAGTSTGVEPIFAVAYKSTIPEEWNGVALPICRRLGGSRAD